MFCGFFFSGKTNNVWPSCLHLTMGSGEVVVFLSFPLDFAFTSSQRAPKNFQPIRLQLSSPCFSTNPPPPSFPYLVYFSRNIFFRARLIRENEGRKETGEKKGWEEEVATVQWPPSYPTTPPPVFFSQKTNSKKKRKLQAKNFLPEFLLPFAFVSLTFPWKTIFPFLLPSVCGQLPSVVTWLPSSFSRIDGNLLLFFPFPPQTLKTIVVAKVDVVENEKEKKRKGIGQGREEEGKEEGGG